MSFQEAKTIKDIVDEHNERKTVSINIVLSVLFGLSGFIFFMLFFDSHYKTLRETNISKMLAKTNEQQMQLFITKSLKKM